VYLDERGGRREKTVAVAAAAVAQLEDKRRHEMLIYKASSSHLIQPPPITRDIVFSVHVIKSATFLQAFASAIHNLKNSWP
jgi:hypothetical protein